MDGVTLRDLVGDETAGEAPWLAAWCVTGLTVVLLITAAFLWTVGGR